MKKNILLSLVAVGALTLGVGCASVESEPDDSVATRSTSMSTTRETTVAPLAPTRATSTRSTTIQSY